MNFNVSGGKKHWSLDAYTGKDVVLHLLPRSLRLRVIARKILRHEGFKRGAAPDPGALTFSMPGEVLPYEIVGWGRVRPFKPGANT